MKFHTLPHLIYTRHLSRVSAHTHPSEILWEVGLFRRHPKRRVKHVTNDIKIIFDSFLMQTRLTWIGSAINPATFLLVECTKTSFSWSTYILDAIHWPSTIHVQNTVRNLNYKLCRKRKILKGKQLRKRYDGYRKFYQQDKVPFRIATKGKTFGLLQTFWTISNAAFQNWQESRIDCMPTHSCKKSGYQAQSRESEFKIDMDLLVLQNLRSNDLHTHLGNLKNRPPFHLQPHTSSLSPLQLSRDRNLQLIIELL